MNELKHSRPNGQISAEAAEWLIEFRTGEVSAASRATFDAWIRSSPEHLRAYLEMATIWHDSGEIDRWQAIDVQALIERARTEVNLIPLEVGPAGPARESVDEPPSHFSAARLARDRMSSLYRGRVAVTALLCSVAVVWTLFLWWQHGREPTYSTATGEQRTVRLSDGSTVELNSRSGIRVRFSEHERDVELLEGQALFRVATVHDRPFVVLCDNTRIQAVGTQFDVNRKPGMTVVTVVEGRIAVAPEALSSSGVADTPAIGATTAILAAAAPDRGSTYLSAGQQLAVARGLAPRPIAASVAVATAWRRQQLVLESVPLAQVADEFNRYSTKRLIVEDSGKHLLRLSGVFATDPRFLLRYLRERPDITIQETDTEIHILRHD